MAKLPPAYQQVITHLKNAISEGRYREEEKLPSESELMKQFGVSRITVTRALTELELTGAIYRVKGRGSFVSKQSARTRKIISLVLPHRADFFSGGQQYIHNIGDACRNRGYLLSVNYSEQSSRKEKEILEVLLTHRVDGIILYPINNRNINMISRMMLNRDPLVLLDRALIELNLPTVRSDNFRGALEGTEYMINRGHREIGFVGAMDAEAVKDRYRGYCQALMKNKIPVDTDIIIHKYPQDFLDDEQETLSEEAAGVILERLLDKGITAVFCANDLTAWQIYSAAGQRGIGIPEDLSLMGFDSLQHVQKMGLTLSSVAQDFEAISRTCVSLLVDAIENGRPVPTGEVIIPTRLTEGKTVGDIRN